MADQETQKYLGFSKRLGLILDTGRELMEFWVFRYSLFVANSPAGTDCTYARGARLKSVGQFETLRAVLERLHRLTGDALEELTEVQEQTQDWRSQYDQ